MSRIDLIPSDRMVAAGALLRGVPEDDDDEEEEEEEEGEDNDEEVDGYSE
jgi:hypothetical protein